MENIITDEEISEFKEPIPKSYTGYQSHPEGEISPCVRTKNRITKAAIIGGLINLLHFSNFTQQINAFIKK